MAESRDERAGASVLRVFAQVGFVDVMCMVAVAAEWIGAGLVDPALFFTVILLRAPIWAALLWWLLGPLRAWQDSRDRGQASDEQLAAIDDALIQVPTHFGRAYALLWALVVVGLLLASSPDRSQVISGVAFLTSIAFPSLVVFEIVIEHGLAAERRVVSEAVARAGLLGRRAASSISDRIGRLCLALTVTLFSLMAGYGVQALAEIGRIELVADQVHAMESVADQVDEGAPLPADVELVAREGLPALARAGLDASTTGAWADYLPERQRVYALARLDDGQILAREVEPEDQSLLWLGVVLVLVFAAVPVVWFVARLLGKALIGPLEDLARTTQDFVERGQLAALERIVPMRNDEVGQVVIQFNTMLDVLEQLAHAAEAVANGDLEVRIDYEGDLPEAFRGMVARLAEAVVGLRATAVELASVAAEIHGLTQGQREAAELQSTTVTQVGGSVSALSDSAENIAARAQGVMKDAERAVEMTTDTSEKIAALRSQTTSIGELVDSIASIADRSDILALNGSLEAVRAGEVGRGFALVADEMRRLAERVGGTLDDVRGQIETIDEAGAGTVAAIDDSRSIAERTAVAAAAISEVTLLQSAETREAWSRMEEVMGMVERSTNAIAETQQAAAGLRAQAEHLETLLADFQIGSTDST